MPTAEKLCRFLANSVLGKFYGTVTIRFEAGKVTNVETETRPMWRYRDLTDEMGHERPEVAQNA